MYFLRGLLLTIILIMVMITKVLSLLEKRIASYALVSNKNVSLDFKTGNFIKSYVINDKRNKRCLSLCNHDLACRMGLVEEINDKIIICNLYKTKATDNQMMNNPNSSIFSIYQLNYNTISVLNNGGYVAKFTVYYTLNGSQQTYDSEWFSSILIFKTE